VTSARPRAANAKGAEGLDLEIDGRTIRVTHPDRIVWPLTGTTKRDLIAYFMAIAPVLLPQVSGRATMLWRFPEGVDGPGWFQAQCRSRPDWVPTYDVAGRRGETLRYCVIEERATLAWLANLGTIELHPHGWTIHRPAEPTAVVFDLDPGPPAGIPEAAAVALRVASALRTAGLDPVVKTSGSLGLHVAAALAPGDTFEHAKAFSRGLAEDLAADQPERVVAHSDRRARSNRVYIDWVQNDRNRQLVAAYSPRATAVPQVSTPLTWDEVEVAAGGDPSIRSAGLDGALDRVERVGDLWADRGRRADRAESGAAERPPARRKSGAR
jgi:bifunctional non-homologous end joining protein LigD